MDSDQQASSKLPLVICPQRSYKTLRQENFQSSKSTCGVWWIDSPAEFKFSRHLFLLFEGSRAPIFWRDGQWDKERSFVILTWKRLLLSCHLYFLSFESRWLQLFIKFDKKASFSVYCLVYFSDTRHWKQKTNGLLCFACNWQLHETPLANASQEKNSPILSDSCKVVIVLNNFKGLQNTLQFK